MRARRIGTSHIRPMRDGVRFLLIIFKVAHALFAAKAFSAGQRRFLPDRSRLLRLHLLDGGPLHQHERADVHFGHPHLPDRHRFRTNLGPALQGDGRRGGAALTSCIGRSER